MSDDFARWSVVAVLLALLLVVIAADVRFDRIERRQRESACFVRLYAEGSGDSPADVAAACRAASQN